MRTRVYRTNGEQTDAVYYEVVLVEDDGLEIVDACLDEAPALAMALATSTLATRPEGSMPTYDCLHGDRIAEFANGKRLI